MRPTTLFLLPALVFTGCSQYATVSERNPHFAHTSSADGTQAKVQQAISDALKVENKAPLKALGEYLASAAAAGQELARNPKDESARTAYNFAVSRVFGTIKKAKLDPWTQPLRVPSTGGDFLLTHRPDSRKKYNPALYTLTPADQFDVKGTYVSKRTVREGVGAPLLAVGRDANTDMKETFSLPRTCYGMTAVARFEGRKCILSFEDPLASETTTLNGRTYPLAADFTVPIAVMLAQTDLRQLELGRLLRPEKYADTARIARLEPYDPNKRVVVVVHGLKDSPATWAPMINHLRGDEYIRRHYQFWFFSYPSGYPYPYSASILRHQLDAIEKKYPLRHPITLIGHSMGGCISRLMITDAGDKLWNDSFGKPPAQVDLSPKTKQMFEDALIFHHRKEVGRVIFIAAPLRGSDMAKNWIGRVGSSLVHAPSALLSAGSEAMKFVKTGGDSLKLKRLPNSVDTMASNNRFVQLINQFPLTPGIPYNTICGDRGRGGHKDHTEPQMTDGFVPYWSSHLDGAESELIVPSNHSAHQNPQAIAEVDRILRAHATP